MQKDEVRKLVKAKKATLTPEFIEEYSRDVCERLISLKQYRDATVIYSYLAFNTEISTETIIEKAWQDGKKVAVPKVFESGLMEFIKIDSLDDVESGFFNIPEPKFGQIAVDKEALIIMPGLAFDKNHNRIGYGGGYYDRFLERKADCNYTKISLAYDFQIFDELETEAFDEKVDLIITKKGLI